MKSFHLICNMPMFLEENFRSFWKSPQVFRSHLKSFGSQKSVNSRFNPYVHLSSFQTKKKLASQPYFQYQNNCFKVFLPQPSKCPPPLEVKSKDTLFGYLSLKLGTCLYKNGQCLRVPGYPDNEMSQLFNSQGELLGSTRVPKKKFKQNLRIYSLIF